MKGCLVINALFCRCGAPLDTLGRGRRGGEPIRLWECRGCQEQYAFSERSLAELRELREREFRLARRQRAQRGYGREARA